MKVKIKTGAFVGQDHCFGSWPVLNEYHDYTEKADTIFEAEENTQGQCVLRADGFGVLGKDNKYGNGAIYAFRGFDELIIVQEELTQLRADLKASQEEVERLEQNVCDSCLVYEDDGTPQTTYGWNENAVEGQHACVCIEESGPYQVLEADSKRLLRGISAALTWLNDPIPEYAKITKCGHVLNALVDTEANKG